MKKYMILCLIFVFIFPNICYGYYEDSEYVWSETTVQTSSDSSDSDDSDFLDLSAESAILVEQTTGTILYEKNSHEQLRPASVTKIMSILLIMEAIDNRHNYI